MECRRSKKKCGNFNSDGICERCLKRDTRCEPYISHQGARNDLNLTTTKSIHPSTETPKNCYFLAARTAKVMDSNVSVCEAISPKNIHPSTKTPINCCFLAARTAKAMDQNVSVCGAISPKSIHPSIESPTNCCSLVTGNAKANILNDMALIYQEQPMMNHKLLVSQAILMDLPSWKHLLLGVVESSPLQIPNFLNVQKSLADTLWMLMVQLHL